MDPPEKTYPLKSLFDSVQCLLAHITGQKGRQAAQGTCGVHHT